MVDVMLRRARRREPAAADELAARWIRGAARRPLPDAVRLLEYLADASGEGAP